MLPRLGRTAWHASARQPALVQIAATAPPRRRVEPRRRRLHQPTRRTGGRRARAPARARQRRAVPPLRDLAASARFHVERARHRRRHRRDALPEAPTFDWNLLLDAARAGACDAWGAEAGDRRTGRSGSGGELRALEEALGGALGLEAADLASAYRSVLLNPEWSATVDLQLARARRPSRRALLARRWRPPRGRPPAVPARGVRRGAYPPTPRAFPPRDGARWWRGGRGRGVGGAEDRRGVRAVRAAAASLDTGGDLEFGQLAGLAELGGERVAGPASTAIWGSAPLQTTRRPRAVGARGRG